MTLKHSCLLTCSFTILIVAAMLGAADAASSSTARANPILYYDYYYPLQQGSPDCNPNIDGCSQYSDQN
jgi:hypothetical protein